MPKYTPLFDKTILALRRTKPPHLLPTMLKKKFKTGYVRSAKLWEELVESGIVEDFPADHSHASRVVRDKVRQVRAPKAISSQTSRSKRQSRTGQATRSIIASQILVGGGLWIRIVRHFCTMANSSIREIQQSGKEETPTKAIIKYQLAFLFFRIGNLTHAFWGWLTRFYPFSLLFRDRWFHADNRLARCLADHIEESQ